jgi:hypothetical protein
LEKNRKYFFLLFLISFGVFQAGNLSSRNNIFNLSFTRLSGQSSQHKNVCLNNASTIQDLSFDEDEDIQDTKNKTNLNTSFVLVFSLRERVHCEICKTSFTETTHQNLSVSKIFILNSVFRL